MSGVGLLSFPLLRGQVNDAIPKAACLGLSREIYGNAGKIREVTKTAFTSAGLPAFGPHSLRKTVGMKDAEGRVVISGDGVN